MAGLTTSCTIPPLRHHVSSSSSLQTKSFAVRLHIPYNPSYLSVSGTGRCRFVCRYFGGGRRDFYDDDDFDDFDDFGPEDDDPALNIRALRSRTVRLIDQKQTMIGIVSKIDAERRAQEAGLDLVIVSEDAEPPVVKIVDYSKYVFEKEKKIREQQKKVRRSDVKEIKLTYKIESHDYSVRLRNALKFLKDGNKVKLVVSLKGRENQFKDKAVELMLRFQNDIGELAVEDGKDFQEKMMYLVLAPNKATMQRESAKKKNKKVKSNELSPDPSGDSSSPAPSGGEVPAPADVSEESPDVSQKEVSANV